jgi:endonuclease YncB( thermonuclease family)
VNDVLFGHKVLNKNKVRLVCVLVLLPAVVAAEVYEWIDAQGKHHYSDRHQQDNARIIAVDAGVTYYAVEKIYDGDTILLNNGQKVRLLGINTPEVAGRHKNAEQGGEEAKAWLQQRLQRKKVRLEADVEKHDRYQRILAHVFTEDKQHVNLELVRQGLATVNIYPPNLKYIEALLMAQHLAEQEQLGIWAYPDYAPQAFQSLNNKNYKGWKRITGQIQALKGTKKYIYLQFSDSFSLRIDRKAQDLFPALQGYVGKNIEARGWISKSKDRYVLNLRHPADLILKYDQQG